MVKTFPPLGMAAPRLDIDGSATYEPLTDGLLIIRYLFGLTGTSLINGAVARIATRSTAAQLTGYLNDVRPMLDIDGNGDADALTDGLLMIRYLFGIRGQSLIAGAIGTGATRSTFVEIEQQLQSLLLPNVIRGPYLMVATPTRINIRWRTDVATTTGRVRYGTDPANLASTADSSGPGKDHEAILVGLSADTRYYYASACMTTSCASGRTTTSTSGAMRTRRSTVRAKPICGWCLAITHTPTAPTPNIKPIILRFIRIRCEAR